MSGGGGRWRRVRGLVRKESVQVMRDPSSVAIAFVLPLVLLVLFGYGVSLDAEDVPVALVIEQPSEPAARFAASFGRSDWFTPDVLTHRRAAEAGLVSGRYRAMLVVPQDFAGALEGPGPARIQLITDGVDNNTARLVRGYVEGAFAAWLQQSGYARDLLARPPVSLEHRVWFNAEVRSRNFLVPGIIAIIMTLIGTLLTALVVAREWERGTMEALMATPVGTAELVLGKVVPYFVLGMGSMALSTLMAVFVFDVPFRGSVLVLTAASALFLLAALAIGLLISTAAKNQFVAGQIAILSAFLPAFMLSGFLFDIASMPAAIQAITYAVPARYFVAILQSLFLAGTVWSVIWTNMLGLLAVFLVFLGLTARITRNRLE